MRELLVFLTNEQTIKSSYMILLNMSLIFAIRTIITMIEGTIHSATQIVILRAMAIEFLFCFKELKHLKRNDINIQK